MKASAKHNGGLPLREVLLSSTLTLSVRPAPTNATEGYVDVDIAWRRSGEESDGQGNAAAGTGGRQPNEL